MDFKIEPLTNGKYLVESASVIGGKMLKKHANAERPITMDESSMRNFVIKVTNDKSIKALIPTSIVDFVAPELNSPKFLSKLTNKVKEVFQPKVKKQVKNKNVKLRPRNGRD